MSDIDPEIAKAVRALADLSDDDFATLVAVADSFAHDDQFEGFPGLDPAPLRWLLTAIAEPEDEVDPERDRFVQRIVGDSFFEEDGETDAGLKDRAASRILQMATTRAFRLRSKLRQLRDETGADLDSARIVTDARPVFDVDDDNEVSGYVIMHSLRLDLRTTEGRKREVVHCSHEDLKSLKTQIERAEAKAEAVKRSLDAGDEVVFDV